MNDSWKDRTRQVHAGTRRSQYGEVSEALFLTQGFVYPNAAAAKARFETCGEDEYIYARYANPTVAMFEDRIAAIEGAEAAFATASGMAAINGVLFSQLRAGDHVVASGALFGSSLYILETLLRGLGVEVDFVEGTDMAAWKAALRPDTRLAFVEAISNPTLEVVDIAALAGLVHGVGALLVVDNVFATPVFQRTLALGADVLVYSATKHIDGQGRTLGGVVLGRADFINGDFLNYMKHTGGALSPFNAWVMLKGLETLDLRCRAQAQTALQLAEGVEGHPALEATLYPYLPSHPHHALARAQMSAGGTVLSLVLRGGEAGAFAFLDALEIPVISNNLGDAKSIVTHPATTTHSRLTPEQRANLGIGAGLVRFSVGLEDPADLLADVRQALDLVEKTT